MQGLTIVVAGRDPERFHAALSLAAANAALDRRTRLFLQGDAASLIRALDAKPDVHHARHGVPSLGQIFAEARALGVEFIVCQSGLALAGLSAEDLPEGASTGGLIELLRTRGDDELVMA